MSIFVVLILALQITSYTTPVVSLNNSGEFNIEAIILTFQNTVQQVAEGDANHATLCVMLGSVYLIAFAKVMVGAP